MNMERALMRERGLPNCFWGEAITIAVHLINVIPTSILKNKTPYEAWNCCKPKVSHLRLFGCIAYTLIPSNKLQKLDTKSERCVFIGYCLNSKAYRWFNPIISTIIISRDLTFNEDAGWDWNCSHKSESTPVVIYDDSPLDTCCPTEESGLKSGASSANQFKDGDATLVKSNNGENSDQDANSGEESLVRKVRSLKYIYESCTFALNLSDPTTHAEAVKTEVWREAMRKELNAIERNGTWELIEPPPD